MIGEMTRAQRLTNTLAPFKKAATQGEIESASLLFQAVVTENYKGDAAQAIADIATSTLGTSFQTAITASAMTRVLERNDDQAVQNMGAAIRATLTV